MPTTNQPEITGAEAGCSDRLPPPCVPPNPLPTAAMPGTLEALDLLIAALCLARLGRLSTAPRKKVIS